MKLQCGSALIMVLCICAVLMIATTSSWYTASLLHDASCVRQQAFQRKQSAQGLLVYATQKIKQRFEDLYQVTQPTMVYQGPWPCGDHTRYTGCAISCKESSYLKIYVTLKDADKQVATATALLSRTLNSHDGVPSGLPHQHAQQSDDDTCSVFVVQWSLNEIDVCG